MFVLAVGLATVITALSVGVGNVLHKGRLIQKWFMENKKKTIKAVAPFAHPGFLNFKQAPFEAWKRLGGDVAKSHYPPKCLHGAVFDGNYLHYGK